MNISILKTQVGQWLCSVHKVMERLTILTFKLFQSIFHQKGILANFKVRFIKFSYAVAHLITEEMKAKNISHCFMKNHFSNVLKLWNVLKYSDFKLPSSVDGESGFHISCYRRFNALSQSTRIKIKSKS